MARDSLTFSDYMEIAKWLITRVEPRIGAPKPVSAPTLGEYTPEEKELLLAHLRKEREAL